MGDFVESFRFSHLSIASSGMLFNPFTFLIVEIVWIVRFVEEKGDGSIFHSFYKITEIARLPLF